MIPNDQRNPTLTEIIEDVIDVRTNDLHTSLPGKVLAFNATNQTVDVQPSIKRYIEDKEVNIPVLKDVPLRFLKTGDFSITAPIKIDDEVLLIFCERAIDNWLTQGDIQTPDDRRKHDYSDAFAIPMMYNDTIKITTYDDTNLQIRTSTGDGITIQPNGKIEIERDGDKLLQTISDALDAISKSTIVIPSGSSAGTYPLANAAVFTALKAIIDNLKI